MKDKLQHAFGQVHADPARVARTRAFVLAQMRPARRAVWPRALVAAACLMLAVLGSGWLWFSPTAHISIDVNPSLELAVNRFDRVVGVEGWNEDGQTLADSLDLQFTDYTQAVEEILAHETVANLLAEDAVLEITVVGPENFQCTRLLAGVKACTAGQGNARCHAARPEEAAAAHEMGLSCGKYRAYQELLALDPTVTPEEVAGMTMAEIRAAIRQLQGAETGVPATPGGHGHGHRHGWE